MPTIDEAFQQAIQHHAAGQLAEAESIYRQILDVQPTHAGAWHLIGVIAHQVGAQARALECIQRAIALDGNNAAFHSNLGEVYRAVKQPQEAIASYQRAIELNPQQAEAYSNLGNALDELGRFAEARDALLIAIRLKPDYPAALSNLGNSCKGLGLNAEAEHYYRQAIAADPNFSQAYSNLGSLVDTLGRTAEAEMLFREAVRLSPRFAEAWYNLGGVLKRTGRYVDAAKAFFEAVSVRPEYAEAHNNLAVALKDLGHHHDAARHCRLALQYRAEYIEAHNNLAVITEELGNLDEAIEHYREALRIKPDFSEVRSGYLLALNYHPQSEPEMLAEEHRLWGQLHAGRAAPYAGRGSREPERRLRVGFISPDFRRHPVANFMEPFFTCYDRDQFEITLYADVEAPDLVTARLQTLGPRWSNVLHKPDAEVVELIRNDEIDILVDLAGHTARNRLLTFTRRAAPVQASYLGYPNTTGIPEIDYLITDALVDPPEDERFFSERLVRVDEGFSCYRPRDDAPAVGPSPAQRNGYVTFGSLHSLSKLNASVLDLWSRVLHAVPSSRLLLFRTTFAAETGEQFRQAFVERGIAPERLDIRCQVPTAGYLTLYHDMDVTLDVHPWCGHTTACEAMWMGVPVVTQLGNRHAGRMVASVLMNLGRPEWITTSDEAFVHAAAGWADDLPKLAHTRSTLRDVMGTSTLCDEPGFARRFERILRQMWRSWCHAEPSVASTIAEGSR